MIVNFIKNIFEVIIRIVDTEIFSIFSNVYNSAIMIHFSYFLIDKISFFFFLFIFLKLFNPKEKLFFYF